MTVYKIPLAVTIVALLAGCGKDAQTTTSPQSRAHTQAADAYERVKMFCSGKGGAVTDVGKSLRTLSGLLDRYPNDHVIREFGVDAVTVYPDNCQYAIEKARAAAVGG
jgi:hypothetical protein